MQKPLPPNPLFLRPCAGLANRLRAIASAMCAAEDLGRPLCILWRQEALFRGAFNEFFELTAEQQDWIQVVPITHPLRGEVKCVTQSCWTAAATQQTEEPLIIASYSHFYTADPDRWLRHLRSLKPSAAMRARLALHTSQLPPAYVGVHIRRTDSVPAIRDSPTEVFLAHLKTYPVTTHFFVASDDDTERVACSRAFPGRVHTAASLLERISVEGCLQGFLEFLLLAQAVELVGPVYSSFSEVAAAYGSRPFFRVQRDT